MSQHLAYPWREIGRFNHARLVEDLTHSSSLFERAAPDQTWLNPPMALLTRLGQDMLHAVEADVGAWQLRTDPTRTAHFNTLIFKRLFDGRVHLSWTIAAIILGRIDLRNRFVDADGELCFERGLQWFVCQGVHEHRLWHLLSPRLIQELRGAGDATPSPLALMLARERGICARQLALQKSRPTHLQGVTPEDIQHYGLFWCLTHEERSAVFSPQRVTTHNRDNQDLLALYRFTHQSNTRELHDPMRLMAFSVLSQNTLDIYKRPSKPDKAEFIFPRDALADRFVIFEMTALPATHHSKLQLFIDDVLMDSLSPCATDQTVTVPLSKDLGPVVPDFIVVTFVAQDGGSLNIPRAWIL